MTFTAGEVVSLVVALVGGGALYKFLEQLIELFAHKGKSVREELRTEIARLEKTIQEQQGRIDVLTERLSAEAVRTTEWRERYLELQQHTNSLLVSAEAKDAQITALEAQVGSLTRALSCEYASNCPLLRNREEH